MYIRINKNIKDIGFNLTATSPTQLYNHIKNYIETEKMEDEPFFLGQEYCDRCDDLRNYLCLFGDFEFFCPCDIIWTQVTRKTLSFFMEYYEVLEKRKDINRQFSKLRYKVEENQRRRRDGKIATCPICNRHHYKLDNESVACQSCINKIQESVAVNTDSRLDTISIPDHKNDPQKFATGLYYVSKRYTKDMCDPRQPWVPIKGTAGNSRTFHNFNYWKNSIAANNN